MLLARTCALAGRPHILVRHNQTFESQLKHTGKSENLTLSTSSTRPRMSASAINQHDVVLAVVGDVHGLWQQDADVAALNFLNPDMTCLVGDFGNESVELVEQIAKMSIPKVAILGNHDAWDTMGRARKTQTPPDSPNTVHDTHSNGHVHASPCATADGADAGAGAQWWRLASMLEEGADNAVVRQLQALGPAHVGYSSCQVPNKNVAVVGGRPFSHGGSNWKSAGGLTAALYPGIVGWEASAQRIAEVAAGEATNGRSVVLMAHNAQTGLGDQFFDLAGVDWRQKAGDHGDKDLRLALDKLTSEGVAVPLVLVGHMHNKLSGGRGLRRMVHVDSQTGTITLNAAVVPRVKALPAAGHEHGQVQSPRLRHFLMVHLKNGLVHHAAQTWVQVTPQEDGTFSCSLAEVDELLRVEHGEAGKTVHYYDSFSNKWSAAYLANTVPTIAEGMKRVSLTAV